MHTLYSFAGPPDPVTKTTMDALKAARSMDFICHMNISCLLDTVKLPANIREDSNAPGAWHGGGSEQGAHFPSRQGPLSQEPIFVAVVVASEEKYSEKLRELCRSWWSRPPAPSHASDVGVIERAGYCRVHIAAAVEILKSQLP